MTRYDQPKRLPPSHKSRKHTQGRPGGRKVGKLVEGFVAETRVGTRRRPKEREQNSEAKTDRILRPGDEHDIERQPLSARREMGDKNHNNNSSNKSNGNNSSKDQPHLIGPATGASVPPPPPSSSLRSVVSTTVACSIGQGAFRGVGCGGRPLQLLGQRIVAQFHQSTRTERGEILIF